VIRKPPWSPNGHDPRHGRSGPGRALKARRLGLFDLALAVLRRRRDAGPDDSVLAAEQVLAGLLP
jgi:hypothetical protein